MAINKSDYDNKYLGQIKEQNKANYQKSNAEYKKKKEEEKWYQGYLKADVLDDGYQFGDFTKTLLASGSDIATQLVKGTISTGEKLGDLGAYAGSYAFDLFGSDYGKKVREAASENLTDKLFAPIDEKVNKNSIFDRKSKSVIQSIAESYAGAVTFNKLTGGKADIPVTIKGKTLNMPVSSLVTGMSSGISEAYQKGGNDAQALVKGITSGLSEGISEGMFGMFGQGGSSLEEEVRHKLLNNIENQVTRRIAQTGLSAVGEGSEELVSYALNYIADNGQDIVKDALNSTAKDMGEAWNRKEFFESGFQGFLSGGISAGGTQLVQNNNSLQLEQKTHEVEKILNKPLSETQQSKLQNFVADNPEIDSNKVAQMFESDSKMVDSLVEESLKNNPNQKESVVREQIERQIERGEIDLDTTNRILGGQEYNDTKTQLDSLTEQINELRRQAEDAQKNDIEPSRLNQLTQEIAGRQIDLNNLQNRYNDMSNRIANSTAYQNAYNEQQQRGRLIEATEKGEYADKIYQDLQANNRNNSRQNRELAQNSIAFSKTLNRQMRFGNNNTQEFINEKNRIIENYAKNNNVSIEEATETLKNSMIDGFVNEKGEVWVNLDSKKSTEWISGHEITHLLEGTKEYSKLSEALRKYAESKGTLEDMRQLVESRYKGKIESANLDNELTSDLAARYLLTDQDFINQVVQEKSTAQKIISSIKHLIKQLAPGSREAKQLEDIRYKFEKALEKASKEGSKQEGTEYLFGFKKNKEEYGYSLSEEGIEEFELKTRKNMDKYKDVNFVPTKDLVKIDDGKLGFRGNNYEEYFNAVRNNGILEPISVYLSDGKLKIENGHHRIKVANRLGITELPIKFTNVREGDVEKTLSMLYNSDEEVDSIYENKSDLSNERNRNEQKNSQYSGTQSSDRESTKNYDRLYKNVSKFKNRENNNRTSNIAEDVRNSEGLDNSSFSNETKYSISDDGSLQDYEGKKVTLETSDTGTTGTLMAIHNLSEDKLKGIIELGGFPVPSIAVTKPGIIDHNQYGDISVLFDKETINPANKLNEIYDRDVWTPTFPTIEYDIDTKVLDKIRNIVGGYGNEYLSNANSKLNNIEDSINRIGYDSFIDELKNNKDFKYVYYKNINPDFEIFTKETSENVSTRYSNEFLKEFIDEYGKEIPNWYDISDERRNEIVNKFREKWIPQLEQSRDKIIAEEQAKENPRMYIIGIANSKIENNLEWLDSLGGQDKLIENLNEIQKTNGTKEVKDIDRTNEYINSNINQEEYENWLKNTFDGITNKKGIYNGKDIFTASGNRRSFNQLHYDYNLQNLVKALTEQKTVGGEKGFGAGQNFGTLQAKMSNRFNSIEDIKNAENRLKYDENSKEIMDNYSNTIYDYMSKLNEYNKFKSDSYSYYYGDNAGYALNDFAEYKVQNIENLKKALEKNSINSKEVPDTLLRDIVKTINELKEIPTDYFEAKPQRAVGLDEIQQIVIPSDTDSEFKKQLQDLGLQYVEYDRNIEGDRNRVINQFDNLKFNVSNNDIAPYEQQGRTFEETQQNNDIAPIQAQINDLSSKIDQLIGQSQNIPIRSDNQGENVFSEGEDIALNADIEKAPYTPVQRTNNQGEFKVRRWAETSTQSESIKDYIKLDDLPIEAQYYKVQGNQETLNNANEMLEKMGYEGSIGYFENKFNERNTNVNDIALGERLIQEALNRGDTKQAIGLIQDVSILGTELGRQVQALSMIQRLTPEGQLMALQRTIDKAKNSGDTDFDGIEITDEMVEKIFGTYNEDGSFDQEELNKVMEDVKQEIALNMDTSTWDKVRAWRYLSMLGNPKTHIRNVVSNAAMLGTRKYKNAIARTLETILPIENRTKTWAKQTDFVKEYSKQKAIELKNVISGESDYSMETGIKTMKRTFDNKFLESLYNFNSNMLEKEDALFSNKAFSDTLSEYLTANGIKTQEDIDNNPTLMDKAIAYSVDEARKATFRQESRLANIIKDIESRDKTSEIVVGSILPFKKTPINIAKTALEYSPMALLKTAVYDTFRISEDADIQRMYKGKTNSISASQYIDNLSKGLTGTSLTLLGYFMASLGMINGSGDDDKEGKYDSQLGKQAYSLNIGKGTYTLSWLSPVAMPLFVGANAYEEFVENKHWNADVVVESLAQTLDPLNEMSFLQGLTQTLTSYNKGTQKIAGIFESAAQNYLSQFIPTLSSQIASTADEYKRSTKASKDTNFKFGEETINKLKYKIPGLRNTLEKQTDIWGNEIKQNENFAARAYESFLAPYAKKKDITTDVDLEIKDIYGQTGNNAVLPNVPSNYVKFQNETYKMNSKDFTKYKEQYGQTAYEMLEELFQKSAYKNATTDEKAKMIDSVYDYAREESTKEFLNNRDVEYTNTTKDNIPIYKENKIKSAIENNMSLDEIKMYNENPNKYNFAKAINDDVNVFNNYSKELSNIKADKDAKGNSISGSRKQKVLNYINNLNVPFETKMLLLKKEYSTEKSYDQQIVNYVWSQNLTAKEKYDLLEYLGFKVVNGQIYS